MKNVFAAIFVLCWPMLSVAQEAPAGSAAYSVQQADVFSFISNPAALAGLPGSSAGLLISQKFLLAELTSYDAVIGMTTATGNFGLRTGYSGFNEFNRMQAGIAYGRKAGDKLFAGVHVNYHSINAPAYSNLAGIIAGAGIIIHLSDKFLAGMHFTNGIRKKMNAINATILPAIYGFGCGYSVSDKFYTGIEIIKQEDLPVNVNASVNYEIVSSVVARLGFSTTGSAGWLAIGLLFNSVRIDIRSSFHPQLGISPGLLLIFNIQKKKI